MRAVCARLPAPRRPAWRRADAQLQEAFKPGGAADAARNRWQE
jgi:hypothetical protein